MRNVAFGTGSSGCTIIGDTTGNLTNVSANLAGLANNGGPTLSHLPNSGSPADGDANGTARCDMGATEFGSSAAIVYTYDPLNRLTRAQYPDGSFFAYTYDAVGNRLTNAGGVAYTWNANGNLINDGVYTYTYDTVNRLSSVAGPVTASYAYNGMGARMRQVTGGITTTYTLDLNAGLVQVLADSGGQHLSLRQWPEALSATSWPATLRLAQYEYRILPHLLRAAQSTVLCITTLVKFIRAIARKLQTSAPEISDS